ncbi:MAG: histidinol-phosphate transaminase [Coriobacteriales bacterium]|jgi:histidinol-phosphate aminotransferase|nr:histidinol-phosphate transaminase [Coriobacteriales bacterium]
MPFGPPPSSERTLRAPAAHLADLAPYDPKYLPARVLLSANESPWGLTESVRACVLAALADREFNRYPDPLAADLRAQIATYCGVRAEQVLIGNGGDELIFDLLLAWGTGGRRLLIAPPSFGSYEIFARLTDTEVIEVARRADKSVDEQTLLARLGEGDIDLLMLASPNNPTGECLSCDFVERLLAASDAPVLLDQAYLEFADPVYDASPLLARHDNLVLLRTFSKAFGLAGIRLGYLLANPAVIHELVKVRQPYSVDSFSTLIGSAVLADLDALDERVATTRLERERVAGELARLPDARVYPSEANFLLVSFPGAAVIWQRLYEDHGVLVRDFSHSPGLEGCLRISIGTPEENDLLLEAMRKVVEAPV